MVDSSMTRTSEFRRSWYAIALVVVVPVALFIALPRMIELSESVRYALLTLAAVAVIHLLDRVWLVRDTAGSFTGITSPLKDCVALQTHALNTAADSLSEMRRLIDRVESQTRGLVATSSSLDAMSRAGIVRLYASRDEASADIARDLLDDGTTVIRLMGVSLNDFLRGQSPGLGQLWRQLVDLIQGKRVVPEANPGLTIMVLIIDPECTGAQLRSRGESRHQRTITTLLKEEVAAVAREFLRLQQNGSPRVTVQCRLYRLPPILFLCHADEMCYVQPYHFWTERKSGGGMPVAKYVTAPECSPQYPMHTELREHFDLIWKEASISVEEYVQDSVIGIDKGASQAGMASVFLDHGGVSQARLLSLLQSAKREVSLQGISLHSFFSPGELFEAIAALIDRDQASVDVKLLLLDPDSEQAKLRAFREHLFLDPGLTFPEYCADDATHKQSTLYRDTLSTLNNLSQWLRTLTSKRQALSPNWQPPIQVRKYSSAPACFILRVDDVVLVEQYHYGKDIPPGAAKGGVPVILGKDMPLIEYRMVAPELYDPVANRSPYTMIVDHLEFVFQHSPDVEWLGARG